MRRKLQIISLVIAVAVGVLSSFTVGGQNRRDNREKLKKIEEFLRDKDLTSDEYWTVKTMTAETLARLPTGGRYIIDLKGAIYEFDTRTGPIDFRRVALRTARGEEALAPRLEKALTREELARWYSQGFRIGNAADFRSDERNPSARIGFTCDANYCDCSGLEDCRDMLHHICGGDFFACTRRGGGPVRCICSRH